MNLIVRLVVCSGTTAVEFFRLFHFFSLAESEIDGHLMDGFSLGRTTMCVQKGFRVR